MRRLLMFLVVLTLLLPIVSAQAAQEKILAYDTLIKVQDDASVIVTETIRVQSTGDQIRRGIYRDFPTTYRDNYGNRVRIDFQLLSIERDGAAEAYRTEGLSNGLRIYIGRESVFLPPGEYTYVISYRVNRVLGFFAQQDELYWNVTGNDWAFPIERASATVILPTGVPHSLIANAYTGYQGATGMDFSVTESKDSVVFVTTRSLAPGEGLTIAVAWPKGYVTEPTSRDKLNWFFRDNLGVLILLLGLLLVLLWYLYAWNAVGRDPRKGVIFPRYTPPEGFSPAAIRYIRRMGYDNKAFTAAVINLAVHGRLTIEEEGKHFVLADTGVISDVAPEEEIIHSKLFALMKKITLINTHHTTIGGAINAARKQLASQYKGKYFHTNTVWMIPGIVLTLLSLVLSVVFFAGNFVVIFLALWLTIWSFGTGTLLLQVRNNWRQGNRGAAAFMGCFSIPFVLGWFVAMGFMLFSGGAVLALSLAVMLGLNLLFAHLLKAPTYGGREVLDEIEGFKMFLEVAEKDYLQWSAPPERTPELFEQYLPFALALDVDQEWAEKFATVLALASADGQYRPGWYHGRSLSGFSAAAFAGGLSSSFNSAIASSGVAPGSSSGSSGGSSGGGGGGGGGGGW